MVSNSINHIGEAVKPPEPEAASALEAVYARYAAAIEADFLGHLVAVDTGSPAGHQVGILRSISAFQVEVGEVRVPMPAVIGTRHATVMGTGACRGCEPPKIFGLWSDGGWRW